MVEAVEPSGGFISVEGFGPTPPSGNGRGDLLSEDPFGPPFDPSTLPNAFLEAYYPQLSKGWTIDPLNPKGLFSGRPQTEEEKAFILDYMQRTGNIPTNQELTDWKVGQGFGEYDPLGRRGAPVFHYLPRSTMGELGSGYETSRQADLGQYYGLERGPKKGGPANFPLMPISRQGELIGYADARTQRGNLVLQRMRGGPDIPGGGLPSSTFQQPDFQELIDKEINPIQQYGLRIEEYLDQKKEQELEVLRQKLLTGYNDKGEPMSEEQLSLNQGEYERLADSLEIKYAQEEENLLREAQSGKPVEQLRLYQQSLNMRGRLEQWYNQRVSQLSKEFTKYSTGEFAPQQPTSFIPPPQQQPYGDPTAEFAAYTQNLGVSQPAQRWLEDNYFNFYNRWRAEGKGDFINWLKQYLASGGG